MSHFCRTAEYCVEAHRSGYQVCSTNVVVPICEEHVFSVWPNRLFAIIDEDYTKTTRELRGLGLGVDLPLLTAVLLSRVNKRDDIPQLIVELRDEYEKARKELWTLLQEMWFAKSFKEQKKVLVTLEHAAHSAFSAAFPECFDSLSFALEIAQLSARGLVSGLKDLRKHDMPNVRVSAVSFAKKLSRELRLNLKNSKDVLNKILTSSEKRDFGML